MTNIQHSSRTPEHYTPLAYVEAARETMGGIDLDPATTKIVNDTRIKAASYYTKDDDGLTKSWAGRVWLNPPGGRLKGRTGSSAAIWWEKLVDEYTLGHVEQAVFLGFSIEILATSQDAQKWAGDFPICVPRKRIEFLTLGVADELEEGESPTHSNVIVYLPPWDRRERWSDWTNRFYLAFTQFGRVRE